MAASIWRVATDVGGYCVTITLRAFMTLMSMG
jgi:hypothetical protein